MTNCRLRLLSVVMTDEQREATRRRRGHWVRTARRRRELTQKELAASLGYVGNQTGNISKWESGERRISGDMFTPLARALGLPARFLINPPLTDEERLDAAMREAGELEREGWEAGEDPSPADDDEPGDAPRRRSA